MPPASSLGYRHLSQEGIQWVIESVSLWNCGIGCTSNIVDPSLTLIMTVNRRLVRIVDNLEIYAKTFHYNTKSGTSSIANAFSKSTPTNEW